MPRRIIALDDYISASEAADFLSLKHGRKISAKYLRPLSQSKKQPIRTVARSNRLLYNRADLEKVVIKMKRHH
jgi:hypothetical protein